MGAFLTEFMLRRRKRLRKSGAKTGAFFDVFEECATCCGETACGGRDASNNHSAMRRGPKKARFRAKIGLILFRKAVVVTRCRIDGYSERASRRNGNCFRGFPQNDFRKIVLKPITKTPCADRVRELLCRPHFRMDRHRLLHRDVQHVTENTLPAPSKPGVNLPRRMASILPKMARNAEMPSRQAVEHASKSGTLETCSTSTLRIRTTP